MSEIKKILMVCRHQDDENLSGVEYHRMLIPHYKLNEHPDFNVYQRLEVDSADDDFLKQFHLIIFSMAYVSYIGEDKKLLTRIKRLGIKTVFDVDDYWILPQGHIFSKKWEIQRTTQRIIYCLENVDHVTTTTGFLAALIKSHNRNVTVIQNAIDPVQPQFQPEPTESEKVRFGYIGGLFHVEDVELMRSGIHKLNRNLAYREKYELYLQGFSDQDQSGHYQAYEKVFEQVIPIQGTNPLSYAQGYNLFDVALAPLVFNIKNSCKSELKMIEAGFMGKAIIVSKTMPYTTIAKNGTNCLAVVKDKNSPGLEWYRYMKLLIDNPAMINDLASELYEDVKVKYHIDTTNEIRKQLYSNIINH